MTAFTRSAGVKYGDLQLGYTSTGYILDGPVLENGGYRQITFTGNVIIRAPTPDAMYSLVEDFKTALREPYQDVVIRRSGLTTVTYQKSDQSGFNTRADFSRDTTSIHDTAISRYYSFTIVVDLPADHYTANGLQGLEDFFYSLSEGANGQRVLNVSGTYTPLNGIGNAKAVYEDQITALRATIKALVDPSSSYEWELLSEDFDNRTPDVEVSFEYSQKQVLYKKTVSSTSDAQIKNPVMLAQGSVVYGAQVDPGFARPVDMEINYEAVIDSDETTDLTSVWLNKVRPLMVEYANQIAQAFSQTGDIEVMGETPLHSPYGNAIRASLQFMMSSPDVLYESSQTESTPISSASLDYPVYGTSPASIVRVPGFVSIFKTVSVSATVRGGKGAALGVARAIALRPLPGIVGTGGPSYSVDGYKLLSRAEAENLGARGGQWELRGENPEFDGPYFAGENGGVEVTTCKLTRVYRYVVTEGTAGGLSTVAR